MDCVGILDCLDRYKDASDSFRNILLVLAAVIGLVFLFFRTKALTLSSQAQDRSSEATTEQVKVASRQASLAERGHLTDRYIKAIDQLGAIQDGKPNIEVRLGGIYGLEMLARESKEHHAQIMEVLTAYVRRNSRDSMKRTSNDHDDVLDSIANEIIGKAPIPREDIQAIITVIGRRIIGFDERVIDLSYSDLSGCMFGGNYERVLFNYAICKYAVFHNVNISNADFFDANCDKADFKSAYTHGVDFEFTSTKGADFGERPEYAKIQPSRFD